MHYSNPIIPGFHPDPSICRVNDDYFLVTSSFEYFPGVPLFHSRDLVHWRRIGHCLTRNSQLPLDKAWESGGIYAPVIRHHDGVFYMITTNTSQGGNFYVHTRDPRGEWSDPVWLPDVDGIDPDLFFDDDGTVYITSSGRIGGRCRIVQTILDLSTGKTLAPSRDIWEGTGATGSEGPHIYKINGVYFLMIAEGGTEYGHMVVMARGPSPSGPWEPCPRNPILTHRSTPSPIQATGHADLIQAHDGSWWMVCLGIRPQGFHACHNLGRETFLSPVAWDADGWPIVGNNGMIALEMTAPSFLLAPPTTGPIRDDFDTLHLDSEWNFIRNPVPGHHSLTQRPGWLTLHGPAHDMNNMQPPPCWIGRRQCHVDCRVATLIDFDPVCPGEEAGLTVFQNYKHHYEIALTATSGERRVIVRRRIGTLQAIVAESAIASGPIVLAIIAHRGSYHFAWSLPGGDPVTIAEGESRYLSTEVGGRFTGVYFALYATGNGKPCGAPAWFDWFEYEGNCTPERSNL